MRYEIEIQQRRIEVELSPAAERALQQRAQALTAELELYFSCLIRKQVRFHDNAQDDSVAVCPGLQLRFHPVMTAHCGRDYEGEEPPLTDFPIRNAAAFIPHWARIHFQAGRWQGEFGYGPDRATA